MSFCHYFDQGRHSCPWASCIGICLCNRNGNIHDNHIAGFRPFEKKLKAKKTQNSRKKLKLKLITQIFGIFEKIVLSLKKCFIHL